MRRGLGGMWSEVCALCYNVLLWGWFPGGSQGCQLWASSFLLPRESLMACHANRRTSHSLLYDMGVEQKPFSTSCLPVVLECRIIHQGPNDESQLHIWCTFTWGKIKTRNASETQPSKDLRDIYRVGNKCMRKAC